MNAALVVRRTLNFPIFEFLNELRFLQFLVVHNYSPMRLVISQIYQCARSKFAIKDYKRASSVASFRVLFDVSTDTAYVAWSSVTHHEWLPKIYHFIWGFHFSKAIHLIELELTFAVVINALL